MDRLHDFMMEQSLYGPMGRKIPAFYAKLDYFVVIYDTVYCL